MQTATAGLKFQCKGWVEGGHARNSVSSVFTPLPHNLPEIIFFLPRTQKARVFARRLRASVSRQSRHGSCVDMCIILSRRKLARVQTQPEARPWNKKLRVVRLQLRCCYILFARSCKTQQLTSVVLTLVCLQSKMVHKQWTSTGNTVAPPSSFYGIHPVF